MKKILTKNQAISVLHCIENSIEIDIFQSVPANDKKYKLSCEELEQKLLPRLGAEQLAGVVENEVDVTPKRKM